MANISVYENKLSLQQLVDSNAKEIFEKSKYKPKK
jgi:hypothetical protein